MEIGAAFLQASEEVLSMFGMKFDNINRHNNNILFENIVISIDLKKDIQGKINLILTETIALKIISAMMGGMTVESIDDIGKSALGELLNMISGNALMKLPSGNDIDISPPQITFEKEISINDECHEILIDTEKMYLDIAI
ncbi:chemotaxis protein CheX [Oceanirhabdus sp. W0125-5]|uniref:chemotaxis protein CheX n=1 Tax=Oceanirhabdus sp. W0125-5 TaxID=2999116 RepID=UPI0022F31C68|nr:chemotaxis protein CheX [Oceanirhabdus sp. W0125-5]WBW97593.1 chemotaxis protein CheX [Oceanirhabdus sp. W0125-5]